MPLETTPDTKWYYSSGTTNIISRIIRQASGGTDADFFGFPKRELFDKLGMQSAVIEPDPDGVFVGSSFMYATPRDWARLGLLYLNDGVIKGERILPEGWVKYSTTPTPMAPKGEYGAQVWLNRGPANNPGQRLMPNVPVDMFSFEGFEGQQVAVIPSHKLVVVRLGITWDYEAWNYDEIDFFLSSIIKAVSVKSDREGIGYMEKKACSSKPFNKYTAEHFKEAEKLIIAGIIARLNKRYEMEFKDDSARFAAAVVGIIFNIPEQEDDGKAFSLNNREVLDSLVGGVSKDREICGILTQAFIMRIVHASRLSGCKTEDLYGDIERLKNLGLYLEYGPPPTPSEFIQKAEAFFLASRAGSQ